MKLNYSLILRQSYLHNQIKEIFYMKESLILDYILYKKISHS